MEQGGGSANNSSDFVRKLYKMLESPQDENVVRWGNEGDSFVVLENEKFTKHILPKHFKHSNFASFVRQLNKYDFHKVRHNNEESGQSPYGQGAWEFKHPDFKMNNKEALDNIRRKAPAPRKPGPAGEEFVPSQQMDMFSSQLVATQQQLQQLQARYEELSIHHSMLLQELIGLQKTVVNHEHVMQNVMSFLHSVDAQRRRDSRVVNPFQQPPATNGATVDGASQAQHAQQAIEEDVPASPLQHATKLLSETNVDNMLNPKTLEHMNELTMRMNGTLTTPPPDFVRQRPASRGPPHSASSSGSMRMNEFDNLVYPVGHTQGIDPAYSEHIHNIPYTAPPRPDVQAQAAPAGPIDTRKKSTQMDPGWVRQPQILLVEDDQTCRRIGGKFLYAFNCSIDSALDGLEAVNKMNAGSKYDLVLMDIIMPNLDGVSACHLIRQFDSTPIIAMTSNIRSDDIQMYFQHGMNDVLPKPFTKEGLLMMLEKHLAHLKKPGALPTAIAPHADMGAVGASHMPAPPVQPLNHPHAPANQSMKDDNSPSKSPATGTTGSNWNSPNQVPGVSPAGSAMTDEYMGAPPSMQAQHPGPGMGNASHSYGMPGGMNAGMPTTPGVPPPGAMGYTAMPPKGKKGAEKGKAGGGEEEREDPLQAVILTDSFETRFRPFTIEKPRCLLPLANIPLIEYTFEFLANAGVDEVYVYCGAHTDQVVEYVEHSRYYSSPSSPFSKVELLRSTSRSVGDAMRDLDKRNILSNDFIVVYGDIISNLPLDGALSAHRARRATDKGAIMTMILREAGVQHRTRTASSQPVFVIDPKRNRCLHYEEMAPHSKGRNKVVTVDPDVLFTFNVGEIDVRNDIIDCGVDICTPDALALWTDNFDFEEPRRGFVYGVLKDWELNDKRIYTHIIDDHYAARVRDLKSYDAVSKDVVGRWAYPLCPDSNFGRGQSYRLKKGNIYMEEGVILARSCEIRRRTVIGQNSSIGDGTTVANSVIGRRCMIGKNVVLDGAYVWDDTVIGDGTVVRQAIVANEAHVGRNCNVEPGALVSYGVRIADGLTVRGSSRVTRMRRDKIYPSPVRGDADPKIVGAKGDGFEFVDSEEDDEDDSFVPNSLVYNMANLSLSSESISTLDSEDDFSDEPTPRTDTSARGSFLSIASDDSSGVPHGAGDFHHDAAQSIFDSLIKGDESTNMQLELTALRMSANATEHQVRRAVVAAFMKRVSQLIESGTSPKQAASQTLEPHKTLISRTMFDKDKGKKDDQVDFLLLVQADLAHRRDGENVLAFVCNELYDMEVLEQEGFEQWWEDGRSKEGEGMERVRAKMGQMLEAWFGDSDDEDDDDDDEEEEDDE
ncbi:hypothetical protein NA57DRAFT_64354 [Rhizodiscina lignyota]|uniref:Mannose-1-phosphate guanyltransferase n=1 Tax=Rhizodiscina lignyota TaxID=1504668 RepID=A0A9P4IH58_9PEZI|nr:hypothetical protein NA57DRAFT_64354 [Rhizodiscina lignyota]